MSHNPQPQSPAQQCRTYFDKGHATFRRSFKAKHDVETQELLFALKKARHIYFIHGINPAEIDALLEKYGV